MKWSAFKPQDCDTAPFRPHLCGTILGDASWSRISGRTPEGLFLTVFLEQLLFLLSSFLYLLPGSFLHDSSFLCSISLFAFSDTSPLFFSTSTCCFLFPIHKVSSSPSLIFLALIFSSIFPLQSLLLFSSLLQVIFFSFLIRLYLFFLVLKKKRKKKETLTPALHDFNGSSEQSSSESFLFVCPQTIL